MISFKHFVTFTATALIAVSCTPYPPEAGPVLTAPAPDLSRTTEAQKTAAAQAEARAKARAAARKKAADKKRRENARRARERKNEIAKKKTKFEAPTYREPEKPKPKKVKPKYPTARPIPGKAGFVFNPYTYDQVDVRGVPGGSLVIDPNDPNKSTHKFRVP